MKKMMTAVLAAASLPLTVPADCTWVWNGWESQGVPIRSIQFVPDAGLLMIDDMQADFLGPPGTSYCLSLSNSTGAPARIDAQGTNSVAENDLVLGAEPLPAGRTVVFFYGAEQVQQPFGDGFLCVGAGGSFLARLAPVLPDAAGRAEHALDNTAPVQAATRIQVGSTWHFQAWYQDPAAGGSGFSLTDALAVSFGP